MSFYKKYFIPFFKNSSRDGQTIAEILIGMTIGIGLIMIGISLIVPSMNINKQVTNVQRGATLAKEELDNVRVFSESDWHNIFSLATGTANKYYINSLQSPFTIATGTEIISVNPVTTGLVGWWKFDEGTGTTAFDSSGNNNNGTWNGSQAGTSGYYSIGTIGPWAGTFNSSNTYTNFPDSASLDVSSTITMSAWVYLSSYSCPLDRGIIFNKENSYEWGIRCNSGNLDAAISPNWAWYGTSQIVSLNKWHLVTVTWDGSSEKYYIDGTLSTSYNLGGGSIATSTNCFRIGARGGCGTATSFFNGLIDDVRLYNRALSASEISQIYTSGSFTRYFYVSDVYRSGGYISLSGGTYDPSTKLITVVYSWPGGKTYSVSMYLTRNENNIYSQTDWSQGSGALGAATSVGSQFATSSNMNYASTNGSISVSLPIP